MLASPLYPTPSFSPQHSPGSPSQYRPAADLEAFNSLLPPPIEFIEGSSTGALAVAEGKYTPINVTPRTPKAEVRHDPQSSTPPKAPNSPSSPRKFSPLYAGHLDGTWPKISNVGSGLYNTGNTCFINSTLQCLLHTPPLVRVLHAHGKTDQCQVKSGFCMTCNLREVMIESQHKIRPFTPFLISGKLQVIAKHMRRGRQEDSHEFLRYAIDALQKSCLAGHAPKIDPKVAETTWVHRIFGGRLRSRVTCGECGHHSDTFDSILDLSLDIHDVDVLKDALRKFVTVECLKGTDKYKCEKCKKAVVAEKQFTIHDAPLVLTVHLKRFTPMGRKIGHHVKYDDRISLQQVMSEGQFGPSYVLYGVICHAGGGPNSGHYYAHVKASDGRWHEMNDEVVTPSRGPPVGLRSAYVLFYIRDKGQALQAAVTTTSNHPPLLQRSGVAAGMKKRRTSPGDGEDEEDLGVKATQSFIGPLFPASTTTSAQAKIERPILIPSDPQADLVKKKIEAAKNRGSALSAVSQYRGDSEEESGAESSNVNGMKPSIGFSLENNVPSSSPQLPPSSSPLPSSPGPIPPASFYGTSSKHHSQINARKRKSPDGDKDENFKSHVRTPLPVFSPQRSNGARRGGYGSNPWSRLAGGNNINKGVVRTYGHRKKSYAV